jgi:hypothetical protein
MDLLHPPNDTQFQVLFELTNAVEQMALVTHIGHHTFFAGRSQ